MSFLISLALFFGALVIHEYSHGWVAYRLGDPTAKYSGRLTFNPLAHIDPFGTIILPIILLMAGALPFGWARPIPIDWRYFKKPKRDMLFVGMAGPLANLSAGFLLSLLFRFLLTIRIDVSIPLLVAECIVINIVLGLFNLIPLYPLDGSHILRGILPDRLSQYYNRLNRWSVIALFGIFVLSNVVYTITKINIVAMVFMPAVEALTKLFCGIDLIQLLEFAQPH